MLVKQSDSCAEKMMKHIFRQISPGPELHLQKNAVCENPNVCGELVQKIVSFDTLENAASAAFVNT